MGVAKLQARNLTGPVGKKHGPAGERVIDVRAARCSQPAGLHGAVILHNVLGVGKQLVPSLDSRDAVGLNRYIEPIYRKIL